MHDKKRKKIPTSPGTASVDLVMTECVRQAG